MRQGAKAALWEAGLHPELTSGTAKEACATSAVIGQRPGGAGPESDPQGSPEEARSEGEACVRGRAAADEALEAWARDVSWVMTEVALGGQGAEPESEVSAEKEAFEGAETLLTG